MKMTKLTTTKVLCFLILVVIALMSVSCGLGSNYPDEIMQGVEDHAIRSLYTDLSRIGPLVTGSPDVKIEFRVVEVVLSDRSEERRAYVRFSDEQYQNLGTLETIHPDIPVEFVFIDIEGTRFVAAWIPEEVAKNPLFMTIARPKYLPTDDSMRVLSTGEVSNRVAVMYMPEKNASLWQALTNMRITDDGVDFDDMWERDLDPPLRINTKFIKVSLP